MDSLMLKFYMKFFEELYLLNAWMDLAHTCRDRCSYPSLYVVQPKPLTNLGNSCSVMLKIYIQVFLDVLFQRKSGDIVIPPSVHL